MSGDDNTKSIVGVLMIFVCIGLALGGVALLLYQVYFFLDHGSWLSVSVPEGIVYFYAWTEPDLNETLPGLVSWSLDPQSWKGLHKVLTFFPSALALWVIAIALMAWIGNWK